jgi:hypothetical protein
MLLKGVFLLKKLSIPLMTVILTACSANSAKVETTTSPIDGITITSITGSSFPTSFIYPVIEKNYLGILIKGGDIIEGRTAKIHISSSSSSRYESIFFKADGKKYNLKLPNYGTVFDVDEFGISAETSLGLSCENLTKIAQSSEVFMRVTYETGYVDYFVSDKIKTGADGFEMIKRIASYCK